MVSNQSKLKCSIPLLLALVVLISCLLVFPVAATDYDCSSGDHPPEEVSYSPISHNSHSVSCDDCGSSWSEGCIFTGLSCTNVGSCVCGNTSGPIDHVWSSGTVVVVATCSASGSTKFTCSLCGETKTESIPPLGHSWSSNGCVSTCLRCGTTDGSHGAEGYTYFTYSPHQHQTTCVDCGYFWYDNHSFVDDVCSLCGYQVAYRSTVTIDDQYYWFVASDARPTISLSVTDNGATLTGGSSTYSYVYSGSGVFLGFSFASTGEPSFLPGESYELAAGDHTLYAIVSSGGEETFYTTTVVIDDKHFVFGGTAEASPDVSMTVTETGATLSCGDLTYHFFYTGSGVYSGLTVPGSSEVVLPIGNVSTLSGAVNSDVLFTLISASASETYSKVTQNLADWTGTYLIVYEVSETEGYVFTGVDEKLNSVLTQLVDGNIVTSVSDLAFCPVRIEPYGAGYSIKLLSGLNVGKYIYASPSGYNKILFSDEPQQLTISHDGSNVHILDGEAPFQFNKSDSYLWFRFFGSKPGGQSEIALYKLDDGSSGGEFVLSAGQWEANKSLASATNEYLSLSDWPEGLNPVALSFISNGQSYSSISYRYSLEFGYSLFFDDTRVYGYDTLAAISDPGWQSDAYALIYFAEDQIVSSEFYAWFTSNFCRIGDDSVSPTYSTTINIYDASGLVLQRCYKFSGLVAPGVAFLVTETGCQIYGDGLTYTWVSLVDEFYGFSLTENSEYAVYKPGQYYTLPGGSAMDLIFNLYEVSEDPVNSGSHDVQAVLSGFAASFITPVMAFFNTEFIPGFSFGKMALVAFLFGLLFWLLKVSK